MLFTFFAIARIARSQLESIARKKANRNLQRYFQVGIFLRCGRLGEIRCSCACSSWRWLPTSGLRRRRCIEASTYVSGAEPQRFRGATGRGSKVFCGREASGSEAEKLTPESIGAIYPNDCCYIPKVSKTRSKPGSLKGRINDSKPGQLKVIDQVPGSLVVS